MPYFFVKFTYPTHLIDEVLKKNLEVVSKFPPDPSLGEAVVTATSANDKGIISLNIFEVKEGKFDEASALVLRIVTEYRNIVGLEYTLEVWATAPEAMASLGLPLPG
ncbi:MAG: hypothetical protein ACW98X_09880 [Promethearchaeota archaeon]